MGESNDHLIKIAVVGPESTGKSIMAQRLAKHFGTVYVPEYSREYCRGLNREYSIQDELNMFYGQLALERSLIPLAKNNVLVCDTTFLTIKVWCDHLFNTTPTVVLEALAYIHYDYYLLMDIDLPWEDDPLRDFPHLREHFMQVWKRELDTLNAPYSIISGVGDERFENALSATLAFLALKRSESQ